MNKSYIVKYNTEVHTYDFSGPIGDLFVDSGLELALEYDIEYTVDGFDLDIVQITDCKTGDVIWNNLNRTLSWNDNDDSIWEAAAYAVELMSESEYLA